MTNASNRNDALPLGGNKEGNTTIDGWQILQTLQNTEKLHLDCSHNDKSK